MEQEIHLLLILDKNNGEESCVKPPDKDAPFIQIKGKEESDSVVKHLKDEQLSQCEFCGKAYKNLKRLKDHFRFCHPKIHYKCSDCSQQFSKKWLLKIHIRKHTAELPYSCSSCDKAFISRSQLKTHINYHHAGNNLRCKMCSAVGFYSKQDLENHIRTKHTRERVFQCSACDKSFMSSNVYYQHRYIHFNIKKYSCTICSKSFTRWLTLHNHTKIHKDELPFSCDVCGRAFRQKGDMKKHRSNQHANIPK